MNTEKDPDTSGNSRAHAREPLAIERDGYRLALEPMVSERGCTALLTLGTSAGGHGIGLDAGEQAQLAAWLSAGEAMAQGEGLSAAHARPLLELTITDADGDTLQARDEGGVVRLIAREHDDAGRVTGQAVVLLSEAQQDELAKWLVPGLGWPVLGYTQKADRPTCASCDHWDGGLNGGRGQCRVNPPLTGVQALGLPPSAREEIPQALDGAWPITTEADWCGQHSSLSVITMEAHDAGNTSLWPQKDERTGLQRLADAAISLNATRRNEPGTPGWRVPGHGILTDAELLSLAAQMGGVQ